MEQLSTSGHFDCARIYFCAGKAGSAERAPEADPLDVYNNMAE